MSREALLHLSALSDALWVGVPSPQHILYRGQETPSAWFVKDPRNWGCMPHNLHPEIGWPQRSCWWVWEGLGSWPLKAASRLQTSQAHPKLTLRNSQLKRLEALTSGLDRFSTLWRVEPAFPHTTRLCRQAEALFLGNFKIYLRVFSASLGLEEPYRPHGEGGWGGGVRSHKCGLSLQPPHWHWGNNTTDGILPPTIPVSNRSQHHYYHLTSPKKH